MEDTIAKAWERYWEAVKPEKPTAWHQNEARTAFYAGAFAHQQFTYRLCALDSKASVKALNAVDAEFDAFFESDIGRRYIADTPAQGKA